VGDVGVAGVGEAAAEAAEAQRGRGGGWTPWARLVLHGPWPLVQRLMRDHAPLRAAALTPQVVIAAMSRPWTAALALRLLEQGAETEALVAALDEPVGPLAATCPPPAETHVVCVQGLPDDHPRRGVLGLYVRVPEEVGRRGMTHLKKMDDERRCVYQQVGGEHCLWYSLTDHGMTEGGGVTVKGGDADDDDDGDGDEEDEEEEDDDEGDEGDENEEPEEQEGAWVITRSELLGEKLADKRQVAAQLVDAAMRPTQALSVWSVQASPTQRADLAAFGVQSADGSLRFDSRRATLTLLSALVATEACAPLLQALLQRRPALGPAALLASLEAEGVEPYRRLVARAGLTLGEAAVDALLQPRGQSTRWEGLLRQRAKQPLLAELLETHPRLRAAALSPAALIAAAWPKTVPIALWLLEEGAVVDGSVAEALLARRAEGGALEEWVIEGAAPFAGRWRATEQRRVGGRPVYRHASLDYFVWFESGAAAWLVTGAILVGSRVRRVDGVSGLNRSTARTLSGFARDWVLFPAGQLARLSVRAVPLPPTQLHALVETEACAPLVDVLLQRLPALRPAALLASLETEGVEPYRRLVARAGLTLGEAAVDALLQPDGGQGSRWASLLRQHASPVPSIAAAAAAKEQLFDELIQSSSRLRAAAAEVFAQLRAEGAGGGADEDDAEDDEGEEEDREEDGEEDSEEDGEEEGEEDSE
jgi:hypothetical protein